MYNIILLACLTEDISKKGGNRAIVFLVETSNLKKPTDASLGGPLNVRTPHDCMIITSSAVLYVALYLHSLLIVFFLNCILTLLVTFLLFLTDLSSSQLSYYLYVSSCLSSFLSFFLFCPLLFAHPSTSHFTFLPPMDIVYHSFVRINMRPAACIVSSSALLHLSCS